MAPTKSKGKVDSVVLWQSIIAAAVTIILAAMQVWVQVTIRDVAEKAAVKVEEVKVVAEKTATAVDNKIDKLVIVTDDTHTLVNSNMGLQLRLNASVAGRLADVTKDPADVAAAKEATRLAEEHDAKQKKVDRRTDERKE